MNFFGRISIRWRITIGSVLVSIVFLTGALLVFRAQVEAILASTTNTVLAHDAAPFVAGILGENGSTIQTPGRGQFVAVIDPQDRVMQTTLPKDLRHELTSVERMPAGGHTISVGDDEYRVLVQSVATNGGSWTVITARNQDSAVLSLGRITLALIFGAGVLVVGFGIASWLVTNAALRPVTRMRRQAEALAAQRSTEPLPLGRAHDEIHALATTLNEFISEVRQSVDRERQLVSDASHELRTPLAILMAQLELAHLSSGDAVALEKEIDAAQRSVGRLSGLATGLLELSQLESRAPQTVSSWDELANELVSSVDRARMLAVSRDVTIDYDVSGEQTGATYLITTGNFGRLIANLTSNAITAVDQGGTVRLALRHSAVELLLTVVDSGPGMPEDFLPVAFDRFTRPDVARTKHNGGSGLGLAIVHAIVAAANGEVTLSNAAGFTVTVALPASGDYPMKAHNLYEFSPNPVPVSIERRV